MPSTPDRRALARRAGRRAVRSMTRSLAERAAEALRNDPDLLATAMEVGLVDRTWVDDPKAPRPTSPPPLELVERWLERTVEQRPSLLARLGLTAVQVLATPDAERHPDGTAGPTADLAVAFTDLEDFTEYTATHGDEAASRLLVSHHRDARPVVRGRGGRIVKRLGDGLLLTFPEPEAAILSCIELAEASPLPLRAGVHAGTVRVTGGDVIGHVVNLAARVTESAAGGEVLVTEEVRKAADELPGVRFDGPDLRRFKGVDEAVGVYRARRDG